ncbi:hypothetical protein GF326_10795 [Candidatus Bathyarchaeota archaeon]|nr:hypothetical protein [Candidatus Bathyarchaeota archaeon]
MVEAKETAVNWVDENKERIIEISDEVWDYACDGLLVKYGRRRIDGVWIPGLTG